MSGFDFAVVVSNVELSSRGYWLLLYYPKQSCAPRVIFLQPDLQNSDAKTWHTSICSMSSAQKKNEGDATFIRTTSNRKSANEKFPEFQHNSVDVYL